ADDGQSEGHVDAGVEGQQLHRGVPLVVVHADDGVIAVTVDGLEEDGVGRVGTRSVDALGGGGGDGRGDVVGVLPAEQAVLAGVGVQAAHGDAGPVEEAGEGGV